MIEIAIARATVLLGMNSASSVTEIAVNSARAITHSCAQHKSLPVLSLANSRPDP